MKIYFYISCTLLAFCCGLFACKKEIKREDFITDPQQPFRIYNKDSIYDATPLAQFLKPDGGHLLLYYPGQTDDGISYNIPGLVAMSTDAKGKIKKTSFLGGSGDTYFYGFKQDDNGNVYVCGQTNSSELRKDVWKDSADINKNNSYLAKVDLNAKIIWEIGYTDSNLLNAPEYTEDFTSIEIINNKPICIGTKYNGESRKAYLVSFDEAGKFIKNHYLPTLRYPDLSSFKGSFLQGWWYNIVKVSNSDIIIRQVNDIENPFFKDPSDTGSNLIRFNLTNEQIVWQKHYRKGSNEYKLSYFGLLGNGNLAFFDYFFNKLIIINSIDGSTISSETINNNSLFTTFPYTSLPHSQSTIDGELYFTTYLARFNSKTGKKPFVIKLTKDGKIDYQKVFNINEAGLFWVSKNQQGNLDFLGVVKVLDVPIQKMFSITTDKNGNYLGN